MKESLKLRSNILLFLAAFFWGIAFVAQEDGANLIPAFTFNMVRMTIGGIVLLPLIYILNRNKPQTQEKGSFKSLIIGGAVCGTALCIASFLQQQGIADGAPSSRASFITALYIVLVPIFGLFLKKKVQPIVWIAVVLCGVGLYMLCVTDGFSNIVTGDLIVMCSTVFYATHILLVDYFVQKVDPVKLSCVQFFAVGILSAIPALIIEQPAISDIISAWMPLVYTGVFSCGVAYTCQVVGQKGSSPVLATLIMSLESVFGAIAGVILLPATNAMSSTQIIGCVLMFGAIVLSQLPVKSSKRT